MYKLVSAIAVCSFAFILWIIYLANTGSSNIFFSFIRSIPNGDKLAHLCLFGFLTLAAVMALKFKTFSIGKLNIYYGAMLVSVFVVIEEASQVFIPARKFSYADLAADAVGILSAIGLAYLINRFLLKRQ